MGQDSWGSYLFGNVRAKKRIFINDSVTLLLIKRFKVYVGYSIAFKQNETHQGLQGRVLKMIYCNKTIIFIFLALVVVYLSLPASLHSEDVTLNMDADFIGWEAYLAYGSYHLSNDNKASILSRYGDRINIISPVFANDLDWHTLIWIDWHAYGFNWREDSIGFYPLNLSNLLPTGDEGLDSALSSSEYVSLDGDLSIAKWDKFTYNFGSDSVENTIPMRATILLTCLGLIGLAGFARKRTGT